MLISARDSRVNYYYMKSAATDERSEVLCSQLSVYKFTV